MKLGKIFTGIRKGLEFIEKARKLLTSIEVIGKHLTAMTDELESIWGKDIDGSDQEVEELEDLENVK